VFDSGADGFMLKSATKDELLTLIEQVVEGNTFWQTHQSNGNLTEDGNPELAFARKYGLTRRELEILQLIGEALDNRKIGDRLYISHQTVSVHRKNIMRKLGVNSTASLIKIAFENHLV
ncbi:MAG: response regulator transcription factor, partial [Saprospiraceae bacterium]|nr:response regulator transcription factor [Saprospiraceae bacterium]